jgi:DNA-binding XRE family transcriptional regulator
MSEQTSDKTAPKPTVDQLRAEIKQTRADLGETVQALAAKADVKARALDQVEVASSGPARRCARRRCRSR